MTEITPIRRQALEQLHANVHPKTEQFMDYHHGLEQTVRDQKAQIDQDSVDLAVLGRRVEFLEREMTKEKRVRHEYQIGYFDMKAQVGVLTTAAISACQNVIDTSVKVLEESKASMIRAGVDHEQAIKIGDPLDNGAAQIAERFAALDPASITP